MQLFAGGGPNVGRRFRCCANPQRLSCGFFAGAVRVRAASSQRDLCNWRPGSSLRMHKQHQTKRRRHPSLPCSAHGAYRLLCSARNCGQGVVTPLLASSALSGSYSRTPCQECTLVASTRMRRKARTCVTGLPAQSPPGLAAAVCATHGLSRTSLQRLRTCPKPEHIDGFTPYSHL